MLPQALIYLIITNFSHRCAITIGNIGDYVSLAEKISNGSVFKERIDSAIRLNNKDEMSYYLLGRWCYSVSIYKHTDIMIQSVTASHTGSFI